MRRLVNYILSVWAVISGFSSFWGYTVFQHFELEVIAATTAVAAGAILAMLIDTMIPEAFGEMHELAGQVTVVGFLISFILSKIGG